MATPQPKDFASVLFTTLEPGRYTCKLCYNTRAQQPKSGYSNLMDHLKRDHLNEYVDEYEVHRGRPNTLDDFCHAEVDDASKNIYSWLDWIIMDNHQLSMCEKPRARKYSNLQDISTPTLKKYMFAVDEAVREQVKIHLKEQTVGLMLDAWTEDGTHFVGVIAVTPPRVPIDARDSFLLAFRTREDEGDMGTDSIISLLDDVLDDYDIALGQLCFFVCDHASVNVSLSRRTRVPMIGCSSHRFNLAMQRLMAPHSQLLDKISTLMVKLNTFKNRAILRDAEEPMPCLRNVTRWSSTYRMVHRFFRLTHMLNRTEKKLADHIPTAREELELRELHVQLKDLESVSVKLQTNEILSLRQVRRLFKSTTKKFNATSEYLSPDSQIVKFPSFENAIVKVLDGKAGTLLPAEARAIIKFMKSPEPAPSATATAAVSFADQALIEDEDLVESQYIPLGWIPATSNEVERLFSRAGLVFSKMRRSTSSTTLEAIMMLQYNRSMWDEQLVARAIRRSKRQRTV